MVQVQVSEEDAKIAKFLERGELFYQKHLNFNPDFSDLHDKIRASKVNLDGNFLIPIPKGLDLLEVFDVFSESFLLKIQEGFDLTNIKNTRLPDKNYLIGFPGLSPCRFNLNCRDVTLLEMILIKMHFFFDKGVHFESIIKPSPVLCAGSIIFKGGEPHFPLFHLRESRGEHILLFYRSGHFKNWRVRVY